MASQSTSADYGNIPTIKPLLRKFRRRCSLYNLAGIFNPLFDIVVGADKRSVFYDIDKENPDLRRVDAAFPLVLDCLHRVLSAGRPAAYHTIDSDVIFSSGRGPSDVRWGVFVLHCFGKEPDAAQQLCPELLALLRTIPRIYQAFFSVLEPGKSIPAHIGPTRSFLRYHLGLIVPTENTPTMRAKDEYYTWKTGESMLFDDSWDHEIYNNCKELRAVLIIDVERKFPWPLQLVANFMTTIGRMTYVPRVVAGANREFKFYTQG
ncbi:MAG: aspartyl/asparaginyl beta-hydroxylase domain-containing protein [Bacteroidota bacterium]